jgi:hypothetical protein
MDPKHVKFIVKGLIGICFSFALGNIYKLGKEVDQHIDDYIDAKPPAKKAS